MKIIKLNIWIHQEVGILKTKNTKWFPQTGSLNIIYIDKD